MGTITGTAGDDTLNGTAADDTISGLDGNDTLSGGAGTNTLDGGAGIDTVSFATSSTGAYVYLLNASAQYDGVGTDTFISIENLIGSNQNDVLIGTAGNNSLSGLDGDDLLDGGGGTDDLRGGAGNDVYVIDNASDHTAASITDTSGYDTVRFDATTASTLILFAGDTGIDRIAIEYGASLEGTSGVRIDGVNVDASALGNGVLIDGNEGTNTLIGTAFADTINGHGSDDRITGGLGQDTLTGGAGYDTFVDTAAGLNGDTITDFVVGESIIITDATLANFSCNLVGNTLTYTGGSLTLSAPIPGRIIASAADGGGVELTVWSSLLPPLPPSPGPVNSGPIYGSDTYSGYGVGDYTVASGTYLHAQAYGGELFPWGLATFHNYGTVYLDDIPGSYVTLDLAPGLGPMPVFDNEGLLVVHHSDPVAGEVYGFIDNGDSGLTTTITNSGQIYLVNDHYTASFLWTWNEHTTFTNSGVLGIYTPESNAVGVQFENGGAVVNQAGGQILVEGLRATAILVDFSSSDPNQVELTNAGLIEARATGALSFGVVMSYGEAVNSGTITADVAAYMDGSLTNSGTLNGAVWSDDSLKFTNQAAGVLNGNFLGGYYSGPDIHDTVSNAGVINGDVWLYDGDDIVTNSGAGRINGITDLGFGNDQYTGGSQTDRVAGEEGSDTIDGGGGNDLIMGGSGDDHIIGGAGNDGLYGEIGNDTIVTLGGDVVDGGDGDDRVELGDYAFAQVSGGAGHDTLVLASGAITFDLSSALATGRIAGFEEIALRSNQDLVVRAADVAAIGAGSVLRIDGDSSDVVTLVGSWVHGSDIVVGGSTFTYWSQGKTTSVLVQSGTTVSVSATAPAGAVGLSPVSSGPAALTPGAPSGLDYTPAAYQASFYHLNGWLTVDSGETVISLNGDTAFTGIGYVTVNGTLAALNQEGIEAVVTHFDGGSDATVVNNGVISAETDGAPAYPMQNYSLGAVAVDDAQSLTNNGLIDAYSVYGLAMGAGRVNMAPSFTLISRDVGQITNNGTIQAQSLHSFALAVASAGGVTNSGVIQADGAQGAVGVNASYFVHNLASGVISATSEDNASSPFNATAVRIFNVGNMQMEVTNAGVITGQIAIDVVDAPLGFTLTNSGQIYGDVQMSASAQNDTVSNTGLIQGNVRMGGGNDTFDGHSGTQSGLISGEAGNDRIIGGAGAETISGGAGIDSLTGGAGNDTFKDTAAGLSGDTITDFTAGDRIVVTDASLSGFTISLTGNTLTYTGGSLTLGSLPTGHLVATAAAGGGVQIAVRDVGNDFNGDGRSDLLWRSDTGQLTEWLGTANGGLISNAANAYSTVPPPWHVAGTADVNGDGRDDILWRNDDGRITDWIANANGGFVGSTTFSTTVSTAWHVAGTGDFNGDGRDDILWRSDNGTITDWLANANGTFTASTTFSTTVATSWHVVGTADFNGDGRDDILWRNDSGQLTDWLRTDTGGFVSNVYSVYVPTNWTVAATGDFNGDGYSDVLWRSDSGQMTDWLGSSAGTLSSNGAASTYVPTNWQVVEVGDFNGDGKDDILWRSDTGQLTDWLGTTTGAFTPNSANFSTAVATSWHVQDAHAHGLFS